MADATHPGWDIETIKAGASDQTERQNALQADGFELYDMSGDRLAFRRRKSEAAATPLDAARATALDATKNPPPTPAPSSAPKPTGK